MKRGMMYASGMCVCVCIHACMCMYAYTYVYVCEELLKKRGVMHASGASVSHITCGESYSVALMSGVWVCVCVFE